MPQNLQVNLSNANKGSFNNRTPHNFTHNFPSTMSQSHQQESKDFGSNYENDYADHETWDYNPDAYNSDPNYNINYQSNVNNYNNDHPDASGLNGQNFQNGRNAYLGDQHDPGYTNNPESFYSKDNEGHPNHFNPSTNPETDGRQDYHARFLQLQQQLISHSNQPQQEYPPQFQQYQTFPQQQSQEHQAHNQQYQHSHEPPHGPFPNQHNLSAYHQQNQGFPHQPQHQNQNQIMPPDQNQAPGSLRLGLPPQEIPNPHGYTYGPISVPATTSNSADYFNYSSSAPSTEFSFLDSLAAQGTLPQFEQNQINGSPQFQPQLPNGFKQPQQNAASPLTDTVVSNTKRKLSTQTSSRNGKPKPLNKHLHMVSPPKPKTTRQNSSPLPKSHLSNSYKYNDEVSYGNQVPTLGSLAMAGQQSTEPSLLTNLVNTEQSQREPAKEDYNFYFNFNSDYNDFNFNGSGDVGGLNSKGSEQHDTDSPGTAIPINIQPPSKQPSSERAPTASSVTPSLFNSKPTNDDAFTKPTPRNMVSDAIFKTKARDDASVSPAKRTKKPEFHLPLDNLKNQNVMLQQLQSLSSHSDASFEQKYNNLQILEPDLGFNNGENDHGLTTLQDNVTPLMKPPGSNTTGYFETNSGDANEKHDTIHILPVPQSNGGASNDENNSQYLSDYDNQQSDHLSANTNSPQNSKRLGSNSSHSFNEGDYSEGLYADDNYDENIGEEYRVQPQNTNDVNQPYSNYFNNGASNRGWQDTDDFRGAMGYGYTGLDLEDMGSNEENHPDLSGFNFDVNPKSTRTSISLGDNRNNQNSMRRSASDVLKNNNLKQANPNPIKVDLANAGHLGLVRPGFERTNSNQSTNSVSSVGSGSGATSLAVTKEKATKKKRHLKGAVCSICSKYISRDLKRHMRTHNEVGRFQCVFPKSMCKHKTGYFNRPYDYKKHLLHLHFEFDDRKGKTAHTLKDKWPITGSCMACGLRFVAGDWVEKHILTNDLEARCPYLEKRGPIPQAVFQPDSGEPSDHSSVLSQTGDQ